MVGAPQKRTAVGDDEAGQFVASFKDALPKLTFGFHFQGAGEIVEDDQFRIADEHAGSSGALRLSAGEFDAARTDHRFEIVVELFEVTVHNGEFGRFVDVIVVVIQAEQNIISQGVAEQTRDLCCVGAFWRDEDVTRVGDDLPVPAEFARVGGEQTEQGAQQCRFARTDAICDNCQ